MEDAPRRPIPGAVYDATVVTPRRRGATLEPMLTYGTNPGMGVGVTRRTYPTRVRFEDGSTSAQRFEKALAYMGLDPRRARSRAIRSTSSSSAPAPTGACSDLRAAASSRCRRAARREPGVRALVVPGSHAVAKRRRGRGAPRDLPRRRRRVARAGLLDVHRDERRQLEGPRQLAVSTSNRNFEGRQGSPSGRTLLMSPAMVAAAAIAGKVVDVRKRS
jgi:3-isopropylmalate/(R)-2-methylmalate dehydratase large subunit